MDRPIRSFASYNTYNSFHNHNLNATNAAGNDAAVAEATNNTNTSNANNGYMNNMNHMNFLNNPSPQWGTLDYYITRLTSNIPPLRIDVCNHDLTDEDAVRLARALVAGAGGKTLKKLRLRGNNIGGRGFLALMEAFAALARMPDSDDLDDSEDSSDRESCTACTLALQELDFGRNQICSVPASANPANTGSTGSTGIPGPSGNDFFQQGIHLLFAHAPHLKHLDLEGNNLGSRGGVALTNAISQNTPKNLETLNLYNNSLGDIATIGLADCFKHLACPDQGTHAEEHRNGSHTRQNSPPPRQENQRGSLLRLDLGMNYIGLNGGRALSNFIATNPSLQKLLLLGNSISDAGAIQFAQALKTNSTLVELNLGYNKLTSVGLEALQSALYDVSSLNALAQSNHTLESLFDEYCVDNMVRWGCDIQLVEEIENLLRINALRVKRPSTFRILPLPTILLSKRPPELPSKQRSLPISSVSKFKIAVHLRESMDGMTNSTNSTNSTNIGDVDNGGANSIRSSNMRHFAELDNKLMPEVLEFIASNVGFENMFWLMSHWNMPLLYQSALCSTGAVGGSEVGSMGSMGSVVGDENNQLQSPTCH